MEYLKCDAEGCGHLEPIDELKAEQIGTPCPLCGENLLTQEDYDAAAPIFELVRALTAAGLAKDGPREEGEVLLRYHHHAGKTTIETEQ